jgi:hypothetical protein
MKKLEVSILLLILAVLAITVYTTFIKRESYSKSGKVQYRDMGEEVSSIEWKDDNLGRDEIYSLLPKKRVYTNTLSKPKTNLSGQRLRAADNGVPGYVNSTDPGKVYEDTLTYVTGNPEGALSGIANGASKIGISYDEIKEAYESVPEDMKTTWLAYMVMGVIINENSYGWEESNSAVGRAYYGAKDQISRVCGSTCASFYSNE